MGRSTICLTRNTKLWINLSTIYSGLQVAENISLAKDTQLLAEVNKRELLRKTFLRIEKKIRVDMNATI